MHRHRLIVDTDAKNEADDQYAIVHAVLSPSLDVRGIVAAHFGTRRSATSMLDSRAEVDHVIGLIDGIAAPAVVDGAPSALPDERTAVPSAGSRLIIDEAFAAEDRLYVAFLGPLTDMASALLERPEIQDRDLVVVWVGGPPYDAAEATYGPEYNLSNDVAAANVVFASRLEVWQVPMSVYTMVGVGYAELERRVRPHGPLGEYLVQQLIEYNEESVPHPIEHRSLGDNPAIGLVLNPQGARWTVRPRLRFSPDGSLIPHARTAGTVRVCEALDTRWLVEDLLHKIERHASADRSRPGTPLASITGLPTRAIPRQEDGHGGAVTERTERGTGPIRHVVLFGLRDEVTEIERATIVERFHALVEAPRPGGRRPVVSVESGAQLSNEAAASSHDLGFIVTFASLGDRDYYVGHPDSADASRSDPQHAAFKAFVAPFLLPGQDGCTVFDLAVGSGP